MKTEKGIHCDLCGEFIVKYAMDYTDAIRNGCARIDDKHICGKCVKKICIQRIDN